MSALNITFNHDGWVVVQWFEGVVFPRSEGDVLEEFLVHVPFGHWLLLVVAEMFHDGFGFGGHFVSIESTIGEGEETKQDGVVGILNHAIIDPRFLVLLFGMESIGGFDFCRVALDEILQHAVGGKEDGWWDRGLEVHVEEEATTIDGILFGQVGADCWPITELVQLGQGWVGCKTMDESPTQS